MDITQLDWVTKGIYLSGNQLTVLAVLTTVLLVAVFGVIIGYGLYVLKDTFDGDKD